MEKKTSFNKIIKIVGNIVMIIAIIFIIKGLVSYDIDYKVIVKGNNLLIFMGLIIAYTLSVILTSIPWRNVVYLITGEKIKLVEVATVSTKANVMKYIPGNVFQYIGRNGLAVEKGLKHPDVAMSTIVDVIINLGTVFLLTVFFSFDTIVFWFKEYIKPIYFIGLVILGLLCLAVVVIYFYKKREKYVDTFKRVFSRDGIKTVVINILVYVLLSLYTTIIYMVVLNVIADGTLKPESYFMVIGAVLASWILGFITPGAPGGMGVRETILIMLVGGVMSEEVILLGVVVNRVVSILGDVLALVVMQIVNKMWRAKVSE